MAEQSIEFRTVAASGPGCGVARHFRVQVQDGPGNWRLFEKFATQEEARCCLAALTKQGMTGRIIHYGISPAAA